MEIRKICDEPQLLEIAAPWFSEKWACRKNPIEKV